MSVNTDHAETEGGDPPPDGETGDGSGGGWRAVPGTGDDDTVRVRWSDLAAMRARIDDLEDENGKLRADVAALEAELEATRRGTDATIQRYERLLEKRTGTPRPTGDGADGAGDDGNGADEGRGRGRGILGRLLSAFR